MLVSTGVAATLIGSVVPDSGCELGSVWVGLEWRSGSIDSDASACVQDCGARFLGSLLGVRSLCRSSIECSYSSSSRGLSHGASRASSSMTLGVWYGTLGVGSRDRGVMVSSRGFPQGSSRFASSVVTSRVWWESLSMGYGGCDLVVASGASSSTCVGL